MKKNLEKKNLEKKEKKEKKIGECRDGVVIFKDLPHLYNMSNSNFSCVFLFPFKPRHLSHSFFSLYSA